MLDCFTEKTYPESWKRANYSYSIEDMVEGFDCCVFCALPGSRTLQSPAGLSLEESSFSRGFHKECFKKFVEIAITPGIYAFHVFDEDCGRGGFKFIIPLNKDEDGNWNCFVATDDSRSIRKGNDEVAGIMSMSGAYLAERLFLAPYTPFASTEKDGMVEIWTSLSKHLSKTIGQAFAQVSQGVVAGMADSELGFCLQDIEELSYMVEAWSTIKSMFLEGNVNRNVSNL